MHGGKAPQVQAAAARNVQRAEAERAVHRLGLAVADVTPTEALLSEVQRGATAVAWLDQHLQTLDAGELAASPWLGLWQEERDRMVRAGLAAARAGIEERQVRLAEAQGEQILAVLRRVFADLNLTPEQEALLPAVVPAALRAVTAPAN